MIRLMVRIRVAIRCFFRGLVRGTWIAVWVCGLTLLAGVITRSFFNLQWLILRLVYVGGVFVLLLYVGGIGSSSNRGSGLVLVFLAVMI